MLQVCLWHDFYNIVFKIEPYNLTIIPLPSDISWICTCVIRLRQIARNVADQNHRKGRGDFTVWANTNHEAGRSNSPSQVYKECWNPEDEGSLFFETPVSACNSTVSKVQRQNLNIPHWKPENL